MHKPLHRWDLSKTTTRVTTSPHPLATVYGAFSVTHLLYVTHASTPIPGYPPGVPAAPGEALIEPRPHTKHFGSRPVAHPG